MPLDEEILIQFSYQEAAIKRCFYRGHMQILASRHRHRYWNRHCEKIFCLQNFF